MTDRSPEDQTARDVPPARRHPFRRTDGTGSISSARAFPASGETEATNRLGSSSDRANDRTGQFRINSDHENTAHPDAPNSQPTGRSLNPAPVPSFASPLADRTRPVGEPPVDALGQPAPNPAQPPRRSRAVAPPPLQRDVDRLGWSPAPPSGRHRSRRRSSGLARLVRLLFIIAVLSSTAFAASHQELVQTISDTPQWQVVEQNSRNAVHAAVSIVAEEPSFAPAPALSSYPVCQGIGADDRDRLESGMNLMRGTAEGERLFDQLVSNDICVQVEDIGYNSGYAYGRQSPGDGTWSESYIAVASDLLRSGETDVVASLLVHEATHIDRYISGVACNYSESCTTLANGVDLEEEIAAHGAEAQWWIAAYGTDGKRFATGYDYGLNRLARAFSEGPSVFDAYVQRIRSDSREGASLAQ